MKTTEDGFNKMFRKGLTDPVNHAGYREDAWEAMEAMLDGNKKHRGIIFWLPVLGSIAALLLLVLGFFMYGGKFTSNKNQMTGNHQRHSKLSDSVTKLALAPLNQKIVKEKIAKNSMGMKPNREGSIKKPLSTDGNNALTEIYHRHRKSFLPLSANVTSHSIEITGLKYVGPVDKTEENGDELVAVSNSGFSIKEGILGVKNIEDTKLLAQSVIAVARNTSHSTKTKTSILNTSPRFALTAIASPDINGVGSFQQGKVGSNAGLLFSIGLTKKLTVSTGMLYSRKPYTTSFSDYHATYAFKTNPQTVSADCRVLDIPIDLDYQIYNRHQNKISIGSGLSSYLMLSEKYHYNYADPYTQGPTDYNISNKNKHLLGVLNLNATYQRQLNSKFGVQVQPYFKMPLTGIGYSKIDLQSAGVAVGLSWNINSPHKP